MAEPIHSGHIIQEELRQQGRSVAWLARQLNSVFHLSWARIFSKSIPKDWRKLEFCSVIDTGSKRFCLNTTTQSLTEKPKAKWDITRGCSYEKIFTVFSVVLFSNVFFCLCSRYDFSSFKGQ